MATTTKAQKDDSPSKANHPQEPPRCGPIAESGIHSTLKGASFMSALISDVISGRVTPHVANSACNAAGKMIRYTELTYKYGTIKGQLTPIPELAMTA